MTFAAVLCCAMISTAFTSCSKDDAESNEFYYYRAYGDVTSTVSMFIITDYTNAINSVVGDQLTKKNDQAVINACDAVYAKHKADYPTGNKGSVGIYRYKVGDDNSKTMIKEYKY